MNNSPNVQRLPYFRKKKKSDSTKITHKNVPTAEKNAFNTGAKENI